MTIELTGRSASRILIRHILERIDAILADKSFTKPFEEKCRDIVCASPRKQPSFNGCSIPIRFAREVSLQCAH